MNTLISTLMLSTLMFSTQAVINRYRRAVRQLAMSLRACDKAVRPTAVWHKTVGLKGLGRRMRY